MPNTNFRLQAKNIFLTYSQCPISPSIVASALDALLKEKLSYGLVCQESHQTTDSEGASGLHLHVLLVMKKKFHTRNCRFFDLTLGESTYHPKMEPVRSLNATITYIWKEGNVIGLHCDAKRVLQAAKKKQNVMVSVIAHQIMDEECTLQDLNVEYPGFVMMNLVKIQTYMRWLQGLKLWEAPLMKWNGCTADQLCQVSTTISKWLNSNMQMEDRAPRSQQLWIHGPSATGKTFLILNLLKFFRGYCIPYDANWCDGYEDRYDFAYCDEFHGQRTITWLNQFVEGCPMPLRQRNSKPYIKRKNLPVIICSNSSIRDCYKNASEVRLEALEYRFIECETFHGMRINVKMEHETGRS